MCAPGRRMWVLAAREEACAPFRLSYRSDSAENPRGTRLFGRSNDHVEGHIASAWAGCGTPRQPRTTGGVATTQLLAAAALLAGVDRAWPERDALAGARTTHDRVANGDRQLLSGGYQPGGHDATTQQWSSSQRGWQIARMAEEA